MQPPQDQTMDASRLQHLTHTNIVALSSTVVKEGPLLLYCGYLYKMLVFGNKQYKNKCAKFTINGQQKYIQQQTCTINYSKPIHIHYKDNKHWVYDSSWRFDPIKLILIPKSQICLQQNLPKLVEQKIQHIHPFYIYRSRPGSSVFEVWSRKRQKVK